MRQAMKQIKKQKQVDQTGREAAVAQGGKAICWCLGEGEKHTGKKRKDIEGVIYLPYTRGSKLKQMI